MKGFYSCAFFIAAGLNLLLACNSHTNHSTDNRDSIPSFEKMPAKNAGQKDSFFRKIKGGNAVILPGRSIGNLQVGEKTDHLQRLGKPQKGDAGMCKSLGRWFYGRNKDQSKELDVFSECDPDDEMRPHVKWIRTTDPGFKTRSGIGVNSSFKDIKAVYPDLVTVASYTSASDSTQQMIILNARAKGITFEVPAFNNLPQKGGLCTALVVHDPDKKMPSLYFSFYKELKIFE